MAATEDTITIEEFTVPKHAPSPDDVTRRELHEWAYSGALLGAKAVSHCHELKDLLERAAEIMLAQGQQIAVLASRVTQLEELAEAQRAVLVEVDKALGRREGRR